MGTGRVYDRIRALLYPPLLKDDKMPPTIWRNKFMGLKTASVLAVAVTTVSAFAKESSLMTNIDADLCLSQAKVNEVCCDRAMTPSLHTALKHNIHYAPNGQIRRLSADSDLSKSFILADGVFDEAEFRF